ncbi:rho guanine nucleotide exchange factor 10 isoform X2 [Drosophila virilis]|uniref:rho guanine nucleotide exchange factor 10 isoform X2 n=1 Tax=Drosophila virilis TaxID=7244 RepID=UPI0038B278BF
MMAFHIIKSALDGTHHQHSHQSLMRNNLGLNRSQQGNGVILLKYENKLNSSSWEDTLAEPEQQTQQSQSQLQTQTQTQTHQTSSFITSPGQGITSQKASVTTAQLHSAFSRRIAEQQQRAKGCQISQQADSATIAGGSFSANGGQAAVGVGVGVGSSASSSSERDTKSPGRERREAPTASHSDEENFTEEEQTSSSVSSLSAGNQRNSQLRSTFNKAKQHLSFDKWRTAASTNSSSSANANTHSSAQPQCSQSASNGSRDSNMIMRRASACTMPTSSGASSQREENTAPGESPGGRLSRWFSIRRGSTHQYDVGGRDGRQSTASSFDIPDASGAATPKPTTATATLDAASPQKLANLGASKMMPGVPEYEDDENSAPDSSRFDMDLMIPPGSRANGTARTAHSRLIVPMLPPAPPGLSQQQLKRRHIVAAIVHSENSYVATLQRLVNDYKKPLEECSPPVLNPVKIATLFHCLPDILHSHKLFRISLSECVRNWDRDEKIGDCFVSAFGKPQLLEIYSGFINNFSAAMELAKMEEKRKSALADFFKVKQISAHDRLSFFGLMVKPVQRFPQFILFLQDLLKYTPQGHHDRMSLQLALSQLELLAELLNESKREAEQYQAFKEMLGHISGTFNTRSLNSVSDSCGNRARYLLREDNVTHMEFNQAGFIVKCKQRRLLLLNDKVICVSVAPKQSHDFGATEKLTFKWMFPVNDVEIVDNSASATLSRILTAGLNRGGSLKSNGSTGNTTAGGYANATLSGHGQGGLGLGSPFVSGDSHSSPAAQLTNGADNLCNEMSTLMYDYEVISRIHDLVGTLKGSYKELNLNTTRNVLNTIQGSIQRKDEEMAWVDSCCLQLIGRHKSGKEETFTFQTQTPNVKKEWITELRLAQLALDPNNSPAWERSFSGSQPHHAHSHHQHPNAHTLQSPGSPQATLHTYEQQQLQEAVQQKQSRKMPLFVKAMPVYRSQHQTEVRCGCYYSIANDTKQSGNARRRHKQLNYLWMCSSDGTSSHITVLAQHPQQAGNLREAGCFDLVETQVSALEFVKGLDQCRTREEHSSLLGDLVWLGTDSRKLLIYSARNPEQEEQLGSFAVPGAVQRILYHFDAVFVSLSNATVLIYRRAHDGVWQLRDPQQVTLGESGMSVPSMLPINMNIYASCGNRVYVLNALNGELQRSFEVQHGASQQVNLMAHSGIGLWISLKNSTMLCLYHTETFKHLQDINIASSVLRNDAKKEQPLNNSSIYVTALMACKGLLWVGTNVGIAVTIPLPRLEGVPIISGGINMSCHAHFGPITFLLPLIPKVYPAYKPTAAATMSAPLVPSVPSMGEDLHLPAIDADPKKLTETDLDESTVILRRDLPKEEPGSTSGSTAGSTTPATCMLREPSVEATPDSNVATPASAASSPRSSKLDKQHSLDQSFTAKIRASLANSPAFHRKRFRDLGAGAGDAGSRMSKTLPRGLGSAAAGGTGVIGVHSNATALSQHGEHGYCDVYGLYGKLIFVKENYDAEEGTQGNLMDMMYEGMRRSDPELAAIPGKVCTLDRRLRMKASRPRSLDLSNWSVDSKSSSLYTSSGSEESMGIRLFGGRSVSRNSSSASHKTSGTGSDLGNISENGLMTTADIHQQHHHHLSNSTPKSEDGFKHMHAQANASDKQAAPAAVATLKRKQKQNSKQQQQQNADGPRTVITLMGGRGYWRHVWYNTSGSSPGQKGASGSCGNAGAASGTGGGSGSFSPLTANSNDAHIVVWEKKL